MTDPWADPSSSAPPYAGPPPTTPPAWGQPGYAPGWGYGPTAYGPAFGQGYGYGYPGPWGQPAPPGPRRPGQVVAACVLAFVQAAMVLLGSLYVFFFASIARAVETGDNGSPAIQGLATEGSVVALLQVLSVVALVVGGVLALAARPRPAAFPVLLGALAVQVVLAVYWAVRLSVLADHLYGSGSSGGLAWFALLFAVMPIVGLGLVLVGAGRRWFRPGAAAPA